MSTNPAKLPPSRWTARRTLLGMPLYDIVRTPGADPASNSARGFVAVGRHATGVFAFGGGTARGVFAFAGGAAFGVFAYAGGASAGLVAASGGAALGALALAGGASAGIVAGSGGFTFALQDVMPREEFSFISTAPPPVSSVPWWFAAVIFAPIIASVFVVVRAKFRARRENT